VLAGEEYGDGEGRSKKEAEQAAAKGAVARLRGGTAAEQRPASPRHRAGR